MSLRRLLAAAAFLGAVSPAMPAHADYLCYDLYVGKERTAWGCLPWDAPLPDAGCLVNVVDFARVCTEA